MKKYRLSLFIFRRDLRLHDNTGLNHAMRLSCNVLPCFIFDPRQVEEHSYRSMPALQFMVESIEELENEIEKLKGKMVFFHGRAENVIQELFSELPVDAVFTNRDYTPFSIVRDNFLKNICESSSVDFLQSGGILLNEPENILKNDGTPYRVFTPFFKKASKIDVPVPAALTDTCFFTDTFGIPSVDIIPDLIPNRRTGLQAKGGRKNVLPILSDMVKFSDYDKTNNFPGLEKTTSLSPHLKFGTCSVREVYHSMMINLGKFHPLIRQLYWRDFFTHIAFRFSHVFGHAFKEKYDNLNWDNNEDFFRAWCEGKTGFPMVDAGMRQLRETGFMHNRVRMITASFLVKDLRIDWRWGERYFAQNLIDYDPSVNNGNWQWVASTGCDAQPWFRIFNPWLQQKKYDPDCVYIYRWIPELREFSPEIIHRWDKKHRGRAYPFPVVDHAEESRTTKLNYRLVK